MNCLHFSPLLLLYSIHLYRSSNPPITTCPHSTFFLSHCPTILPWSTLCIEHRGLVLMEKGILWKEIRKQRNCLKKAPSPKPSFLQGLLAMKQEMVWQAAVLTGLFVPSQRIQLTGGPTSCFRNRESWGRTMVLEFRGSFKLISRTEMPYPPISGCNSVSTQHWPKSTGSRAESRWTLDSGQLHSCFDTCFG